MISLCKTKVFHNDATLNLIGLMWALSAGQSVAHDSWGPNEYIRMDTEGYFIDEEGDAVTLTLNKEDKTGWHTVELLPSPGRFNNG